MKKNNVDIRMEKRVHTVDLLKGIGIILVLVTHFSWTTDERKIIVFPFFIDMAVPLFMIVLGYTYSMSFEKHKVDSFGKAYSRKNLLNKLLRYSVPFAIMVVWEMIDPHVYLSAAPPPIIAVVRWILRGMVGHGSYYYPVLIQLVFIFPVIYFIVSTQPNRGLVICFFINFIYELLKWAYDIPEESYRLIALRYIFVVAVGVYAYHVRTLKYGCGIFVSSLGALFIVGVKYLGYKTSIITYWTGTSFIASLWVAPFAFYFLQSKKLHLKPLELLGKASYHIFLTQIVYYVGYCELLEKKFASRGLHLVFGVFTCVFIGLGFYYLDRRLLSGLYRKAESI